MQALFYPEDVLPRVLYVVQGPPFAVGRNRGAEKESQAAPDSPCCNKWVKSIFRPRIPPIPSAASPVKRVAVESEEIPAIVQFSAKPETERWWEFLSW